MEVLIVPAGGFSPSIFAVMYWLAVVVMFICSPDTLAFLNDVVDRIEIDDTISVKLKKNISVDRDTKKIFG